MPFSPTTNAIPVLGSRIARSPLIPLRFAAEGLCIHVEREITVICDHAHRYYSKNPFMETPAHAS